MTDLLHDWHRLMAFVGVHGPLVKTCEQFSQHKSSMLCLPFEIRSTIYENLLSDAAHPTILRMPSGHLCIHLQRPPAFSQLLLVCKQIYAEAVPLPFLFQPFRLQFCNEYLVQQEHPWKRIPHNDAIGNPALRMPRHLAVSLTLEEGVSGLMVQLTRLRLVVEARRDALLETKVSISLGKLANARKRAALHSLPAFLGGQNARVTVEGASDVLEDNSEHDLTTKLCEDVLGKLHALGICAR